jgi:hypothetical protein
MQGANAQASLVNRRLNPRKATLTPTETVGRADCDRSGDENLALDYIGYLDVGLTGDG